MKGKKCTKCRQYKNPETEFHNDKTKKDGKGSQCRQCTKERQREVLNGPKEVGTTKECTGCKETFPVNMFSIDVYTKSGLSRRCKVCETSWRNNRSIDNKRDNYLFAKFKIRVDDYKKWLEDQDYKCAICGRHQNTMSKSLCVDHCHKTEQIRGLLCVGCNGVLGKFNDDADRFRAAAEYLDRNKL